MPKTKFQNVVFTIIMAAIMVYGMIVYNVSLNTGGMRSENFLLALHEMPIMVPIAFVLEFTYEETAQLLKSGLRSALTSDSKRDVAIIYGLVNRLSLGEMDAVLEGYGLPRLVPIK